MNSKAKLISTIAAICMVLVLLVGGIWAASAGTVTIGGTVSFSAQDVDVEITGAVTGADKAPTLKTIRWNAATENNKDTDAATEGYEALEEAWDLGDLSFTKAATGGKLNDIVLTITVKNYSTEREVNVALTTSTATAGDIKVAVAGDTKIGVATDASTPATAELTLTISTEKLSTDSIDATDFAGRLTVTNAGKPAAESGEGA